MPATRGPSGSAKAASDPTGTSDAGTRPRHPSAPQHSGSAEPLSPRELEVVRLVVEGLSNPEIGAVLHLSPRTVQTYAGTACRKLGARNRVVLAVTAVRRGIVP